jgi:hypothetical protein
MSISKDFHSGPCPAISPELREVVEAVPLRDKVTRGYLCFSNIPNWLTYRNEELGFELSFPQEGWRIAEHKAWDRPNRITNVSVARGYNHVAVYVSEEAPISPSSLLSDAMRQSTPVEQYVSTLLSGRTVAIGFTSVCIYVT